MSLVQIENNPRHRRNGTVLSDADAAHAVHIDVFLRVAAGDCAGKVEENPIRVDRCFARGLDWGADSDLDPQATVIA